MSISGAIPFFDYSTAAGPNTAAVVTVTGTTVGLANGTHASETLQAFFQRAANALAQVSGTLSGAQQFVASGAISGVRALQRELCMRIGDLDGGTSDAKRLAVAQAALAVSGEVAFGA